jgi:hypothetical protein
MKSKRTEKKSDKFDELNKFKNYEESDAIHAGKTRHYVKYDISPITRNQVHKKADQIRKLIGEVNRRMDQIDEL